MMDVDDILKEGCCALLAVAAPWLRVLCSLLAALVFLTLVNAIMLTAILLLRLRPAP